MLEVHPHPPFLHTKVQSELRRQEQLFIPSVNSKGSQQMLLYIRTMDNVRKYTE